MKNSLAYLKFEVAATWAASLICLVLHVAGAAETGSGYSVYWLIALIVLTIFTLFFSALLLFAIFRKRKFEKCFSQLHAWLDRSHHGLSVLIFAATTILVFSLAMLVLNSRYVRYFAAWKDVFGEVENLAYFLFLLTFQAVMLVWIMLPETVVTKRFWNFIGLGKALFISGLVWATLLHWAVLFFQVRLFKMIPGWYWAFHPKGFSGRDWLIAVMLLAVCLAAVVAARNHDRTWMGLLIIMVLFYCLQIGFGWMDGGGYESIRLKFAASTHRIYAEHASDKPDILAGLLQYETRYGSDNYLGTKPPGVFLIYAGMQKLSNTVQPVATFQERFEGLIGLLTIVFPVISLLVLIPITLVSRWLLGPKRALLPALLYATSPNALLMPLFLDQVIYPFLFMLGLLLVRGAVHRRSSLLAGVFGVYAFTILYFSFSMLPLVAMGFLWLVLDFIFVRQEKWKNFLFRIISLGAGFLLTAFVFRVVLNYDVVLRYQNAMLKHTQLKLYEPGLQQFLLNTLLNNVEMAAWSGFVLVLLGLLGAAMGVWKVLQRRPEQVDLFASSAIAVYLAILLFSKTRGEVGRIWLFMVPVISILAVQAVRLLFKRESLAVTAISLIQLFSTWLVFKFQDFIT